MTAPAHRHRREHASIAPLVLIATLLVLAPLYRGGNRPLALLCLELVAVAGLAVALVPARTRARVPLGAALLAGLVAAIPLVQLLPLPLDLWSALPGRAEFLPALRDVAGSTTHAISVVPFETEYAALALLPPLAAFLLAFDLRALQVQRALRVLVAVAVIQAVAGLMQYGWMGGGLGDARASGTYVNPNHFAGLLLMVLPVALMGLAVEIGDRTRERVRGRGMLGVLQRAVASKGLKVLTAAAVVVVLLVALVYSRSRAGITLAALGLAITTIAAAPRVGGPRAYGVVGLVLAVVVGTATAIGLIPVIDRFAQADVFDDDRWALITAAFEMAGHYFPLGAGAGTFAALYPPFQPAGVLSFVHRAHDDYVEWIVEGGLLAMVAVLLGAGLYVARIVLLARETEKNRIHYLQVGAAIGLFLMALHALVDFNLRIPANALVFALLGGVVLSRQPSLQSQHRHGRRAHVAVAPIPLAPMPQLDPDAAARVRAAWAGVPADAGRPLSPPALVAAPTPPAFATPPTASDTTKETMP